MDGKESLDQTLEMENVLTREVDGDGVHVNNSCKNEDTEKGISVVVDVSGPPLESPKLACASGSDVENPRSKISEYEGSIIGRMLNGTLNREGKTTSSIMHVQFSLGDLVWVKSISSSWWPGLIFNPSDPDSAAANSEFSNALLVKYFGINRMLWCDPSQLKLFVENFDELSKINNSKMFLHSVDKAVTELSRRLELDMGCYCKSEQGKGIAKKDSHNNTNHAIISKFEPGLFLPFLKCLARDGLKPGFLEVTSVKNLLTSFYRSKLLSRTIEENLIGVSAEHGHESREKRKSKYLSSPYTDNNKSVTEEPSLKSDNKNGGKKYNKKQSNAKQNSPVLAGDDINKPPLQILSNLLDAAVTGHSVSGELYFSEFRTWAFCEKSIFDRHIMKALHGSNNGGVKVKKETEIMDEEVDVKNGGEVEEEEKPIICYKKKKKEPRKKIETPPIAIPDLGDIPEGSSNKKKRITRTETSSPLPDISANETDVGKEKEKPAISPGLASGSEMSVDHQNESVKKSEEGISTTGANSEQKKRKLNNPRVIPGFVKASISTSTGLPDLNGKVNEKESSQGQPRVTEKSSSSAFKTFKKLDFSSLQDFIAINQEVKRELNQSEIAGNIEQTEPLPKKKKMKKRAPEENTNDLNENSVDTTNPLEKPKKKKKKPSITLSDMNMTYKKLDEEDESIGSALLLKFDKEQPPLPSKEALLATFSVFGNLKESETDVFNESHTAQVLFLNGSEAGNAFRSLEKKGPFGPSLITFRLIHLSEPPPEMENARPTPPLPSPSSSLHIPSFSPAKVLASSSRRAAAGVSLRKPPQPPQQQQQQQQQQQTGNLTKMKNNLEMMTRMLEKTGSNVRPDLRLKLENDINGLLARLKRMDGGSN